MKTLLLIAALLLLCGISFFRQALQRTDADRSQSMLFAIVCWFLAAMFTLIAVLVIAHPAR